MSMGHESLSAEVRAFVKKLKTLDLGPIAYKLMHSEEGCGWTRSQTAKAIARYMTFLLLIYLYPNTKIVPTQEIDAVWHHHILDTSKYALDCQMLFGRFVHHFPYLGLRGEADEQNWQAAFTDTQALFLQHFGDNEQANMPKSASELLNDRNSKKPARCNILPKPKREREERPSTDIKAEVLKALPHELSQLG